MFLAHVNDLSNGHWKVYPHLKDWSLFHENGQYGLSSNICPHQGSYFNGTSGRKVKLCPYHGWSFSSSGEPIGSGTTAHKCENKEALATKEVFQWNGFLFTEPHDLPSLDFIDTRHLSLASMSTVTVKASYVKIMNLFLDVDHVPVVHPKLYDEINVPSIDNIQWIHGNNSMTQIVPTTIEDTAFTETLRLEDHDSAYGAAWFAVYPYTMMEWQPGAWFITVCNPTSEHSTDVTVYKYKDTRYNADNWEINESTWDTAFKQDCDQSEAMSNVVTFKNLEAEKQHYIDWVMKNVR
jgi:phenylpropionate dioxygenase-like ring-hydroxylating dioxygenase large terminal subunit